MPEDSQELNILIVADNASATFGGEAILPLHYFSFLRKQNHNTHLLVHERCKNELTALFPNDLDRLHFIPDTFLHKFFWRLGMPLPYRIRNFTTELITNLLTQFLQRRRAKQLIKTHQINIVHQPTPVSPKQPSFLFSLAPKNQTKIILGPMNGGMDYPSAFKSRNKNAKLESTFIKTARLFSALANTIIPGKLHVNLLLVANQRTHDALPANVKRKLHEQIIHLHENAVIPEHWPPIDWSLKAFPEKHNNLPTLNIVFLGRLQFLKAVDTLIDAIQQIRDRAHITLHIIGDGEARSSLEQQTQSLNLTSQITFHGFIPQQQCASILQNAHALCLPSIHECGGAVVLEAMCMQLPTIVADWGGPADYVTPNTGFKIPVTSRDTLVIGIADALLNLANNPSLVQTLGEAGRQRVLSEFNWPNKINQILNLYQSLMTDQR
ncbi:Alpha-D-kanosaminyltransferase [Poriferisphaera corsica]|uniref:Alpha-D-kanosaminyltransferase n=1 Tax=Poriferisphaera corsica TaxID=2528020 RepID=A0A517YQ80_9BACT|nr:glycosyltransferase family 4 protein [Poriferisphaera corsica]QDU32384.1 Alpha-D-kanosaminyltransferase [Poriferisphaera corsica]